MGFLIPQLKETAEWILDVLSNYEEYDEGHEFPWYNYLYRSKTFRRAHLDIVDACVGSKLYMMHLCIFPHIDDPSPIFGFDIISGENKVTGAFHDFSPVTGSTELDKWYANQVKDHSWSRVRELPEWAKNIFSDSMVAAGNIQTSEELEKFLSMVRFNLLNYLASIGKRTPTDFTVGQNKYCKYQKMNPHTPRVMKSIGFDEETVHEFIQKCLFPEI